MTVYFNALNSPKGRREMTPQSCPMTSLCVSHTEPADPKYKLPSQTNKQTNKN